MNKDQGELKTHAVADYMSNGTSNQFTQMFTGDNNAAGIHNEYSAIASGNVTNTVDQLHTAQTQLKAQQDALQQQQSQATSEANAASSAKNQATQLAASDASALDGVNANIKNLVAQQQAAAAAAAAQAAQAKVAAAQQAQASAQSGSERRWRWRWRNPASTFSPPPPTSSGAAGAVQAAEGEIGVPYVWGGHPRPASTARAWSSGPMHRSGSAFPTIRGRSTTTPRISRSPTLSPVISCSTDPAETSTSPCTSAAASMVEAPYTGASVWDHRDAHR